MISMKFYLPVILLRTTKTEKFPTPYSTYMKARPTEQVKVLLVQNASKTNVPSRKNVFVYVGGCNNVFTQKKGIHTDAGVNSFYLLCHCHSTKSTSNFFI